MPSTRAGAATGRTSEGTSSTGRASVSKTEGWGFKSLVPCKTAHRRGRPSGSAGRPGRGDQRDGEQRGRGRASERRAERTSPATFYRQVVAELRKVVWPTQQQLITYFIVVLVFVLVMMALVSVLDLAFGKLVFAVFGGARPVARAGPDRTGRASVRATMKVTE